MNDLNEAVMDLQARVAFQEDTLQHLNAVVASQDQEIRALHEQLKRLAKRLDDSLYAQEQGSATLLHERPPHY